MSSSLAATAESVEEPEGREAEDDRLMERVREGDEVAFARLVDRYQRPLVAYLGRLTGDSDRAEDVAQDAFVRLYQSASRYEGRGRLAPYLFRIATNLVRSQERRRRRWRLLEPIFRSGENGHAEPAAQRRVLADELSCRLRDEIERLPLTYRVPLVLYEVEEWPYARIAELLECREGTVKSRIFRARRRLREALEPYLRGDAQ